MKKSIRWLIVLALLFIGAAVGVPNVEAGPQVGVGIMPGIIKVDKGLLPGGQYKIAPVQVVNTGNISSQYELIITRMARQEELQPPAEFVSFSPRIFTLEAGKSRTIDLNLNIPANATAGNYLAYVEARPVSTEAGGMTIGIAAATKLYFTVLPADMLQSFAADIGRFFGRTSPFSYIVLGLLAVAVFAFLFRRYIRLDIKLSRK